ncbi:unnamed protein product [Dibothriocephalus latus]|uniref:Uncharacterized protein n=1 Tax=Dibothriocephalus latus TaxID=60516 RepID=A0A3P7R9N3_DIBLA|nr:unnamed protein product [Dibothriocephalus latus]
MSQKRRSLNTSLGRAKMIWSDEEVYRKEMKQLSKRYPQNGFTTGWGTTLGKSSWQTILESEAVAATVANQSGAQKPWPAATATTKTPIQVTNPAGNQVAEASDVSRTIRETREAVQLFNLLQRDMRSSSSQGVDAKQMRDFQVVAEHLETLQRKVQSLINGELSECSADITGADETDLANLMSVNDDLQRCIESYPRTAQRDAVCLFTYIS